MEDIVASTPEVIRSLLVANEYGVMPGIEQINPDLSLTVDPPQIFCRSLPDEINYAVLLKAILGRSMDFMDGEPHEHHGLSVLCRAPVTDRESAFLTPTSDPTDVAYHLARSLYRYLGKIKNETVTLGLYTYNIQSIYRTRQVMDVGEQAEKSRTDWVFEVNVAYAYPPYTKNED